MGYVELHCHSAYSFLDGASLPEELAGPCRRTRLRGARAHRPRRGVRLARVRARREAPRGATDHRCRGDARRRRTRDPARRDRAAGYANLCHILTEAHAGTPGGPVARSASHLPPAARTRPSLEEHADGLVCLSGCARRGLAVHDPNAAARGWRAHLGPATISSSSCNARSNGATPAVTIASTRPRRGIWVLTPRS